MEKRRVSVSYLHSDALYSITSTRVNKLNQYSTLTRVSELLLEDRLCAGLTSLLMFSSDPLHVDSSLHSVLSHLQLSHKKAPKTHKTHKTDHFNFSHCVEQLLMSCHYSTCDSCLFSVFQSLTHKQMVSSSFFFLLPDCPSIIQDIFKVLLGHLLNPPVLHRSVPSDVTQWLKCIVGNVCARFWKAVHWFIIVIIKDITFFIPHVLCSFLNLMPTLPTMQLSHSLTSLEPVYQTTAVPVRKVYSYKKVGG